MCVSLVFIILDILAVTPVLDMGGLNPFWKMAFIFKCFTDTIILDDFKTALDKISEYKLNQVRANSHALEPDIEKNQVAAREDSLKRLSRLTKPHTIHVETELRILTVGGHSETPSVRSDSDLIPDTEDKQSPRNTTYKAECFT